MVRLYICKRQARWLLVSTSGKLTLPAQHLRVVSTHTLRGFRSLFILQIMLKLADEAQVQHHFDSEWLTAADIKSSTSGPTAGAK